LIAILGHIILIISAIPPVIVHPNRAVACFAIGILIMGIGTGGFKANISPFIGEQYKENKMHVKRIEKTGELVIVDPVVTYQRIYNYFYLMINVGSLVGSVSMVYAEKYVGFYLAYLLPTAMFMISPMVLLAYKNSYTHYPPTGSVLAKAVKLIFFTMKGQWSFNPVRLYKNINHPEFWERVKPSRIPAAQRPKWMTFDDIWVDEVAKGVHACSVFVWYPVYWLSYNQMTNNLTSQAATMELHGAPNDVINNLDPLALIIFIPIVDAWLYPWLRSKGIRFTPIKRITLGFAMGALAMVWAAVTQHYIYKTSACGKFPTDCKTPAPLNVWIQTGPYVLIAFSEIFASITGLEYGKFQYTYIIAQEEATNK
jgi:POT family proton-dependent oligopeptide transporter